MTANDSGHVNNLDRSQTEALKHYWIALTNAVGAETSMSVDQLLDSDYGKEFLFAIGYDNPDVLLLRWLRARKWNINDAVQQMMDTLRWRRKFGVQSLLAKGESDVSYEEIKSGKTYFMGHDRAGRPINYIHAKNHISGQFPLEVTEKLTVLAMETGRKLLPAPVEEVTIVFDLAGFGMRNMDYQHLKFLIHVLENHYPESFGLGLVINAPWVFSGCWMVIKQWLDPVVESKIRFTKNDADLAKYIDPSVLPRRLNGSQPDFEYIPPTAEDEVMVAAFRADSQGKANAQAAYRKAAQNYLTVTLQWAHGDDSQSILEERTKATKQLQDAFEQLVPYVNTRTHYHRIGAIDEPIFNIKFDQLRAKN